MKQLLQIIALTLFGFTGLQIILALGTALLFLQALLARFLEGRWWKERKARQEIEMKLWDIE